MRWRPDADPRRNADADTGSDADPDADTGTDGDRSATDPDAAVRLGKSRIRQSSLEPVAVSNKRGMEHGPSIPLSPR